MNKIELRQELKTLRGEMDEKSVAEKSRKIIKKVSRIEEFLTAKTVMIYMSLKNEVCADELIEIALKMGKNVVVPVTVGDDIIPCEIGDIKNLKTGKFGIREPGEKNVWDGDIDLVIVPGVGFSRHGGRIGFGKGYYDRFLEGKTSKKIALAYSFQVVDDAFSDKFDIPMDIIVTEEELIYCE